MKAIKQLVWVTAVALSLIACGGSSTKKGSDLKGEDAKVILAGKESKYWQLESGHDYYEFIQFEKGGGAIITKGTTITYTVNGDNLVMKDYVDLTYKIYEISDDKLIMGASGRDTLTFVHLDPTKPESKKNPLLEVNPKWLKGKHGTCWKFSTGDKMYSYMNDGRILDANLLTKIADWKVEGNTLNFGSTKLTISRLGPLFFDYDAYGIPVKMNYRCEANADGSPVK